MKPKNDEEEKSALYSVKPRHSMRATPLAPRPSDIEALELEGLMRTPSADPLSLAHRPTVLGYVMADASGVVSSVGDACDGPFADRVHYFAELAQLVGAELGLDPLTELHASADKARLVWTRCADGGWAAALVLPAERPVEIARTLRGER